MILGFDTSGPWCAVALARDTEVIATRHEDMTRGQAERLIPLLDECLAEADIGWSDLSALAVGVGPGNFTGIRIGVSAARGLALALDLPVHGVSGFDLMRGTAALPADGVELITLPAPRELAYAAVYSAEGAGAPRLVDPAAPDADLIAAGTAGRAIGHRAAETAALLNLAPCPAQLRDIGPRLVAIAGTWQRAGLMPPLPAPLYVRPADAAPPRDAPPRIVA
ncbi:tRNA (adenosine(37)-N6)-threonylcarbamoyltransferase complex dimerization subunit type 1 TsaB [Pseudooceanicola aestuarii]|uniref:tRNA (adenosine(37)-N6)-threonylcarbamoyltransferase complex dimerization subunit type 1 TsaB n=1 Tax=Pseudooceanicola aestuarii TaxID=2697319 RepID=UPI0013D1D24D|nr:tRNA (adenosine(37)-N6)-threonylcarbamoyltransferase complex dimerization subunit type 1 TsaB [Pseudooceanicola aestuarii]